MTKSLWASKKDRQFIIASMAESLIGDLVPLNIRPRLRQKLEAAARRDIKKLLSIMEAKKSERKNAASNDSR